MFTAGTNAMKKVFKLKIELNTYKAANTTLNATLQQCREENKKLKEENKRLKERYPIKNEYKVF